MSSSDPIELAYCAGLFDGEGCISVSPYSAEQHARGYRFHCDVFLGMQDLRTVERFQRTVGVGSVKHRADGLWMWHTSGAKAAQMMRLLVPHLCAKREAALLFVEFAATFSASNRKPLPLEIVTSRSDLSRRIRHAMSLNAEEAKAFAASSNGGTN